MKDIQPVATYKDSVEAPSPLDPEITVKFGIRVQTFSRYDKRGLISAIAQYYGLVQEGMSNARHAFRGLKRPLMFGEDMEADRNVLVYSWRPSIDFVWVGTRQDGSPERRPAPEGRVFVVLVREENSNGNEISGSIEHWNWVREDPVLSHAPVDWEQRYEERLWSRKV